MSEDITFPDTTWSAGLSSVGPYPSTDYQVRLLGAWQGLVRRRKDGKRSFALASSQGRGTASASFPSAPGIKMRFLLIYSLAIARIGGIIHGE
jgi:hypothetical protein